MPSTRKPPKKKLKPDVEDPPLGVEFQGFAKEEVEDDYEMMIEEEESGSGSSSEELDRKDFPLDFVLKKEPVDCEEVPETVRHTDGHEFIAVEALARWKVDQLGCSARIFHEDLEIVVHNLGCLMAIDERFVAKVEVTDLVALGRTKTFKQAKTMLFRQLRIVEILLDNLTAARDYGRAGLLQQINSIRKRPASEEAIQIHKLVQQHQDLNYVKFCQLLKRDLSVSDSLWIQANNLLQDELATEQRNRLLKNYPPELADDDYDKLNVALQLLCAEVVEYHAVALLEVAPEFLRARLQSVPRKTLFQVDAKAVKMFHDLDKVLNKEIFEQPLDDLAERWVNRLKSEGATAPVNPIFFSLCRALEELILEIADGPNSTLIISDHNCWYPVHLGDSWLQTDLAKCLHREYVFIFRLLKHFDPTALEDAGPFDYQLRRLQFPTKIADEIYVWFCLLDDALPKDLNLDLYEQILRNYIQLLSSASRDQMETIRVITLNTARFVVQTFPLVISAKSGEDGNILQAQLAVINRMMLGSDCANFYRDLIDVFSRYWEHRSQIIETIATKSTHEGIGHIKKNLLKIVNVGLGKNVNASLMVSLFRSLNDFLAELNDVPFDWFIKSVPGLAMSGMIDFKLVEPVVNKWTDTTNQTFRVIDPKKFQKMLFLMAEGSTCPPHYIIDAITTLLKYVRAQLECARWTESDQVMSSTALISSMQTSLDYLREQAEYVSFEIFLEESTKPFCSLIETSGQSLDSFLRRVALIKESFCYLRKQNEMSLTEALRMFGELNDNDATEGSERIKCAYQQYCDLFEQFIAEPATIVRVPEILFSNWSPQFKQNELPKILARVAASWSVAISADVSSTGKFFKPHCVQILCILKLLGTDDGAKGVPKHLAQVLTGQGKSLILALIASVLALTGHRIQIACYNEYLVKRDASEFEEFYKTLGVSESIKYGTFEDMANAVIAPVVAGKRLELRTFVQDAIMSNQISPRPKKPKPEVGSNSVLLMDEVDVFFTKEYYGNTYCPASFLHVPGLGEIQEKIWFEVNTRGARTATKVSFFVHNFISSGFFTNKVKFAEFHNNPVPFELLIYDGAKQVRRLYTCRELFAQHLDTMIANAIYVATVTTNHRDYKLSPEGVIVRRVKEKYENRTFTQYYSVFHYFRLKGENFTQFVSPSGNNYGYLSIPCGSLSYAMLPKTYPLILGVTGTLTALHPHEKVAIAQLYNINRTSIMPSFFGCSKLVYDPATNFTKMPTKFHWMCKIFTHVLVALGGGDGEANRAVIVFFHNEGLLEEFRVQFGGQLARLQVLTKNTDQQQVGHLVVEAGVPGTVTLATRAMGRGVDYRSSVATEKVGGVHVIQSFFSLDVKEERQIRGRTARKDNRGSYELVVWEDDLKADQLSGGTYAELDAARANLAVREGEDIAKVIEARKIDHNTTLQYLRSFFAIN